MLMDHADGAKALLDVAVVLNNLCCPFFLMQGTALGAYRDGGFVPHEKDIDIGLLQEHLHGVDLALELLRNGFDLETYANPFRKIRTLVAFKYDVKVDIVGIMRWKDKRFTATPVRPWVTESYALVHDAKMLEPPYDPVWLFGKEFWVPAPIEVYLELEYGSDWRTPKDDHVSRTRVPNFLTTEGITDETLAQS